MIPVGVVMINCKSKIFLVLVTVFLLLFSVPTAYGKETKEENVIYFNVPVTGNYAWGNYDVVYCHIWEDGGDEFFAVAQQVSPFQELLLLAALQVGPIQVLDLKLQGVDPPGFFRLVHLQGRNLAFNLLQGGIFLLIGGL